jgi:drug/metabolite transporter (DMT)-like permease
VSTAALALILVAALAHASWNLLSKQAAAASPIAFYWLVAATATAAYAPVVAVTVIVARPHLAALNWVFLAGTGVLEAGYFLFLQQGYRAGDLSLVYPVGRGTGALLATLAGVALLGERPGPAQIAGIAAIIAGIVVIGLPSRATATPGSPDAQDAPEAPRPPHRLRPVAFALATGAFIASYTLWDFCAVSTLKTPAVLQGYATFPVIVVAFAPLARRGGRGPAQVWRSFRRQVIGAGLLTPLAYMLVLAALSFTAVSAVAPAREISVLFGVVLGGRLLGEGDLPRRLAAAAAIVAGIIAIALG